MRTLFENASMNSNTSEISKFDKILAKSGTKKTGKKNQPNSCHDIEIHAFKLVGNYYTFDVCTLERNGII